MPLSESVCFDIAITLVSQREEQPLIDTLLAILAQEFSDCRLTHHTISELTPESINADDKIRYCFEQRSSISVEYDNGQTRYLHPVMNLGKVKSIIDIEGTTTLRDRSPLLKQMFRLFDNQHVMLENNNHDALTGLLNRHTFETRLNKAVEHRRFQDSASNPDCCFAMLDIDHFKKINDNYGHLYGDEVLILLANLMEDSFRHEDMLFRYGGEEFALLLKNISLDQSIIVLDRFRRRVESYNFPMVQHVTISIGVTDFTAGLNRFDLIKRADQALYYSKENGRNQVNSYEQLLAEGKLTAAAPAEQDIELF